MTYIQYLANFSISYCHFGGLTIEFETFLFSKLLSQWVNRIGEWAILSSSFHQLKIMSEWSFSIIFVTISFLAFSCSSSLNFCALSKAHLSSVIWAWWAAFFQISCLVFLCQLKILAFSLESFLFQFGPFKVSSLHWLDDLLEGVCWICRFIATIIWFTAMANPLPLWPGFVIKDGLHRAKGVFPNYLVMIMCPVYT